MSRKELLARVIHDQIVGVVREDNPVAAEAVADAYALNGIRVVEITLTTPEAIELISTISIRYAKDDVIVAVGSVRSTNDAAAARRAGAQIIVSPHTDPHIIEYAVENDLLSVAGALTPTEVVRAWDAGCDLVKIFPVHYIGGPEYVRTLRGPIRDIPLVAGGPVPLDMIENYLDAGCVAVNLGASLAAPDLVKTAQWDEIGRRAMLAASIIASRKAVEIPDSEYVH